MTSTPPPASAKVGNDDKKNDVDDNNDTWAATANLYDRQATRLTQRHGYDLVGLLQQDIPNATTILDIGCGTGAFAQAYVQYFPHGIPGQTLILSDLSPAMLDKARANLLSLDNNNDDFATKIVFQLEDGTKLSGIADDSVDIVVSLFGVFLIPDQEATRQSIRRVLRRRSNNHDHKSGGVFANASWVFDVSNALMTNDLGGPSLQDVFAMPTRTIDPSRSMTSLFPSMQFWSDRDSIREKLSQQWQSIKVYRASHTSVWYWSILWSMLVQNPMSIIQTAAPADAQRAKEATMAMLSLSSSSSSIPADVTSSSLDNEEDEPPLVLASISNLTICRGLNE
jgi:ubiquinone/menaquinone biosynthesis C-methylase UbiE